MTQHNRYLAVWLLLVVVLVAACRGQAAEDPAPTLAATAESVAPPPTLRPGETPTATPVLPFPAPPNNPGQSGDPTLPTRTPTPAAGATTGSAALPAPVCAGLTLDNPEGPYYTPNTPERSILIEAGMPGERFIVSGYVLGPDCAPIPGAWLDFWHADADGNYDNAGYRLRGHQFTGADGRYRLETVFPGLYPGRTRHIHVKVMAPGGPVLTTQLYFPDEAQNATDSLYRAELEVRMGEEAGVRAGAFDFVVPVQ